MLNGRVSFRSTGKAIDLHINSISGLIGFVRVVNGFMRTPKIHQ